MGLEECKVEERVKMILYSREIKYARQGIGWGLLAGLLWGLDGVVMGISLGLAPFMDGMSPFVAALVGACLHDGFAACWVFIINIVKGKWRDYGRTLTTKPAKMVILAGIIGGPIGMSGNLLGINLAGASYAVAVTAIYPAIGAILGRLFLKEKINRRIGWGIVLSICGSIIVGYVPPESNVPHFYLGICFSLLAAVAWALEGVISTYGMDIIDSDIAVGIREISSFIIYAFIILPLISVMGYKMFLTTIDYRTFSYIGLAAFFGGGSYLAWYRGMNRTGVSRAMSLNITYALWSVVFGWLLSDLQVTWNLVIGVTAITIGTMLTIGNPKDMVTIRNR